MRGDVLDALAFDEHLPAVVQRLEIVRTASHRKASLPQDYARGGQRREWAGRLQKAIAWIELGNPAGLASEQPGRGRSTQIKPHVRLLAGAVAAAVLCFTAPADAQITMKFATLTLNDMQHEYAKLYKEALEKATDGKNQGRGLSRRSTRRRTAADGRPAARHHRSGDRSLGIVLRRRPALPGARPRRPVQGQRACAQGTQRAGDAQADLGLHRQPRHDHDGPACLRWADVRVPRAGDQSRRLRRQAHPSAGLRR